MQTCLYSHAFLQWVKLLTDSRQGRVQYQIFTREEYRTQLTGHWVEKDTSQKQYKPRYEQRAVSIDPVVCCSSANARQRILSRSPICHQRRYQRPKQIRCVRKDVRNWSVNLVDHSMCGSGCSRLTWVTDVMQYWWSAHFLLAITQLELATMGFVGCALLMYILWWHKPFNVELPVTIDCPIQDQDRIRERLRTMFEARYRSYNLSPSWDDLLRHQRIPNWAYMDERSLGIGMRLYEIIHIRADLYRLHPLARLFANAPRDWYGI